MGRDVIILDRPDDEDLLRHWVDQGRVVAHHPRDAEYMTPAEARAHAANYAAAADLADAEPAPDPAEVQRIAGIIAEAERDLRNSYAEDAPRSSPARHRRRLPQGDRS